MRKVRTCTLRNGEQVPLLVFEDSGLPDEDVCWYLLTALRHRGTKFSTMRRTARSLASALAYFEARRLDLEGRITSGDFLSRDELTAFAEHCRQRRLGSGAVTLAHASMQYHSLLGYMHWQFEAVLRRSSREQRQYLHMQRAEFDRVAKRCAPVVANEGRTLGERLGLTPSQRELLQRVTVPGDPSNPFSPHTQVRNRVLFTLLQELPLRAGEALGLKRRDVDFRTTPTTVTIHRRHDDPLDPRQEKPVAKTNPRTLEISAKAEAILRDWVEVHLRDRDRYPNVRRHEFLFVAGDGRPLSMRTARGIFERLRAAYPEFGRFCQHVMRHDWNDRVVEMQEDLELDPVNSEMEQKYANGWAPGSEMPMRYAKRAIRNRANAMILRLQEKSVRKLSPDA